MKYCKFIRQVKSSAKIVYLIALLFLLLLSISCKTKFNPSETLSEETYSIIPKEFSGKYSNDFYKATYETTSSNCIIYVSLDKYENKTYTDIRPIVFSHTYIDYDYGKVTTNYEYNGDTSDTSGYIYIFYTNKKSQRQLFFTAAHSGEYREIYIHVDDINK